MLINQESCIFCNKVFAGYHNWKRFCSRKCGYEYWLNERRGKRKSYLRNYSKLYRADPIKRVVLRKQQREWVKKNLGELRHAIFDKYGEKCKRCGFDDYRALQIDHVNGGGNKEFKRKYQQGHSRSRKNLYKAVLADETRKYQILCANCNWIKKYENNEL